MKLLIALLILTFVLKGIIAEVRGECKNLTLGDKSWDEICFDIQTYCILENEEPTCKCDNDMEFSNDERRCINTLCENGDRGFSECQEKNAQCIKVHNENRYECKCREGFEMTLEEKCSEIDNCAPPNTDGYLTCSAKKASCKQDSTKEKGFYCICSDGKICGDEEQTESTENFVVNRATTFSNEYSSLSTVSQDEISHNFSTNITETTISVLNINTLSEKSDFSLATSTHLSKETSPDSSPVTVETSTNPSDFTSLITKKDNNSSINESSSTESSSTDRINEIESTVPTLKKSFIVFIVGILAGVIIFVGVIIVVLLILKKKKCRKGEKINLKIGDYEKKLGALTPTFIHNENKEINVPEKTIFSLSV